MRHLSAPPGRLVFAIDLDETVFVTLDRLHEIHSDHLLSQPNCYPAMTDLEEKTLSFVPAFLINLLDISMVFEKACRLNFELVILTSGTYEKKSIVNLLQRNLWVSQETREKIGMVRFHSPITDCPQKTEESMHQTIRLNKGERILALRKQCPELRGQWVLFDDNPKHIVSCQDIPGVQAVLATTDEPSKDCYQRILRLLETMHQQQAERNAVFALISLKKSKYPEKGFEPSAKRSKLLFK